MYEDITIEEIINILKRTPKLKSFGIDKYQTFGYNTNSPQINYW